MAERVTQELMKELSHPWQQRPGMEELSHPRQQRTGVEELPHPRQQRPPGVHSEASDHLHFASIATPELEASIMSKLWTLQNRFLLQ